jgi:hypothetical protein
MPHATLREAGLSLRQVVPPVGHLSSPIYGGAIALGFALLCISCTHTASTTAGSGSSEPPQAYNSSSPANYTTIDFLDPYHYGGSGGF